MSKAETLRKLAVMLEYVQKTEPEELADRMEKIFARIDFAYRNVPYLMRLEIEKKEKVQMFYAIHKAEEEMANELP